MSKYKYISLIGMRTNTKMQSSLVMSTRLGYPKVKTWMYCHKTLKRFPLRMYPTGSAKFQQVVLQIKTLKVIKKYVPTSR